MNKVELSGRLTRDPEVRYAAQGGENTCVAKFTVAVDRRRAGAGGEREADFIPCTAFGKQGEFAEKFLARGMKVLVVGRIQTGSYTNRDGQKVYTTDVICEDIEFAESKAATENRGKPAYYAGNPDTVPTAPAQPCVQTAGQADGGFYAVDADGLPL